MSKRIRAICWSPIILTTSQESCTLGQEDTQIETFEKKQAEGNNQEFLCIIAPLIDKIDQLSSIIEKNFEMMINVTIKHMDTVATVTHLVYLQLTLPTLVQEALF